MERIRQAVIVAAPSALQRVAGLPHLKRTILTLQRAGITHVYVVGAGAAAIGAELAADPHYARVGVRVDVMAGEGGAAGDGTALLAVKDRITGPFLLSMADHVYDAAVASAAAAADLTAADLWLGVDRRLDRGDGHADTVKVSTEAGRLVDVGASIAGHDGLVVGVLAAGAELFRCLEELVKTQRDCAVLDAVRVLAARRRARVIDVGTAWWDVVATPAARRRVERHLLRSLTKPTDGFIARHVNRRCSRLVTGMLLDTSVTPNQMTVVANLIGYLGIWLVAGGTWGLLLAGAVLVQVQSILDGCDGEIARLKFQGSRLGEWLDNVLDDTMNIAYPIALGHAAAVRFETPLYRWLGIAAGASYVINNAVLYTQLVLRHGSGNPFLFRWWFQKEDAYLQQALAGSGVRGRLLGGFHALGRRDVFLFAFMILCALRQPQVAVVWYAVIAAIAASMAIVHVLAGGLAPDLRSRRRGAETAPPTELPARESDGRREPPPAS